MNSIINELHELSLNESNDQKLVELLELVGLVEGVNFCYDDEVLIPDDIDESLDSGFDKQFPIISISSEGGKTIAKYINDEQITKTVELPSLVYKLLAHYSKG